MKAWSGWRKGKRRAQVFPLLLISLLGCQSIHLSRPIPSNVFQQVCTAMLSALLTREGLSLKVERRASREELVRAFRWLAF
jgi:hypothetical protein